MSLNESWHRHQTSSHTHIHSLEYPLAQRQSLNHAERAKKEYWPTENSIPLSPMMFCSLDFPIYQKLRKQIPVHKSEAALVAAGNGETGGACGAGG